MGQREEFCDRAVLTQHQQRRLRDLLREIIPDNRFYARKFAEADVVAPAHSGLELLAQGEHQQRNFAVARCAAEAYLGRLDDDAVRAAAASTLVPGRFQIVVTELPYQVNPDNLA